MATDKLREFWGKQVAVSCDPGVTPTVKVGLDGKREPFGNIGLVRTDHAPRPMHCFTNIPLDQFIGTFVKLGFPCTHPGTGKPTTEHMWVKVTGIYEDPTGGDAEELIGTLANDPIMFNAQCGDEFAFSRAEVEQMLDKHQ